MQLKLRALQINNKRTKERFVNSLTINIFVKRGGNIHLVRTNQTNDEITEGEKHNEAWPSRRSNKIIFIRIQGSIRVTKAQKKMTIIILHRICSRFSSFLILFTMQRM